MTQAGREEGLEGHPAQLGREYQRGCELRSACGGFGSRAAYLFRIRGRKTLEILYRTGYDYLWDESLERVSPMAMGKS